MLSFCVFDSENSQSSVNVLMTSVAVELCLSRLQVEPQRHNVMLTELFVNCLDYISVRIVESVKKPLCKFIKT